MWNENCVSLQLSQMQKNQLKELQEHLERYCIVLLLFGFSSGKYDLNSIKSDLIPILVSERDIEPTVIKTANYFISFKFNGIHLLDIMNFVGGATSLDSFLKAYRNSETKGFFHFEWFDRLKNCRMQKFPFMLPFKVNFVALNLLKLNTRTILTY